MTAVALQLPPARTLRVRTPDGLSIAAQDWGHSDEPAAELLLLHGYSQAHPCWLRQIESSLTRQFRLVSYDLRGHGSSEKPAGHGVGISNLSNRLRLHYGEKASFEMIQLDGNLVRVRIQFPLQLSDGHKAQLTRFGAE